MNNWDVFYSVMRLDKRAPISKRKFMNSASEIAAEYILEIFKPYILKEKQAEKGLNLEKLLIDNPIKGNLRVGNPLVYNPSFENANPSEFDILIHKKGITLVSNVHEHDDRRVTFYHYDLEKVYSADQDDIFLR